MPESLIEFRGAVKSLYGFMTYAAPASNDPGTRAAPRGASPEAGRRAENGQLPRSRRRSCPPFPADGSKYAEAIADTVRAAASEGVAAL